MSATDEYEDATAPVYSCKRCKKTFSCKRDQLLHKKEVHYQAKSSFECKLCSKFFCNSGNLERHMKVHNDVRPFVCSICEKAFSQAVNLQRHYSVHNGHRPYQCSFCTKSFTQQSNMQRHQLTHTGEKPFRCKRCGRYFSQRVNLKKHIMGHLNTKPFACTVCAKSFIQLTNFKKHLQSHVKDGVDIDIAATVEAAAATARQMELSAQPVAYECAVCRCIFTNFADFEMHESQCKDPNSVETSTSQSQSTQPQQPQQQVPLQQQQSQPPQQQQQQQPPPHPVQIIHHQPNPNLALYGHMKFEVSHAHELIIEQARRMQ